jgi:hypothetical protein
LDISVDISILAVVLSGFALYAQYYGIFATRFEISKKDKVMLFMKIEADIQNQIIIGGIVSKETPQVISLRKTYYVSRSWFGGSDKPLYQFWHYIGDLTVPIESIMGVQKFPKDLVTTFDGLHD